MEKLFRHSRQKFYESQKFKLENKGNEVTNPELKANFECDDWVN